MTVLELFKSMILRVGLGVGKKRKNSGFFLFQFIFALKFAEFRKTLYLCNRTPSRCPSADDGGTFVGII